MTDPTPHRATLEQWAHAEEIASMSFGVLSPIVLELRDRLAAAEQRISELESNHPAKPDSSAPAVTLHPLREPSANHIAECGGPCQEGFWHCNCGLLEQLNPELRPAPAAPAGSLVEVVARAIHPSVCADPNLYLHEARAAIRAVASWIHAAADAYPDTCGALHAVAQQLEQEADQ